MNNTVTTTILAVGATYAAAIVILQMLRRGEKLKSFSVAVMMATLYLITIIVTFEASSLAIGQIEKGVSAILREAKLPAFEIWNGWILSAYVTILVVLWVMRDTLKWFIVNVPVFMGLITENYLNGNMVKSEAGLTVKFPWELVRPDKWFVLEVMSVSFEGQFPTADGGVVKMKGVFRYKASFARLEKYAEVDELTVGQAIVADAMRIVTEQVVSAKTKEVAGKIPTIHAAIEKDYGDIEHKNKLEEQLGIDFINLTISDIEFAEDTAKTLTAALQSDMLFSGDSDPISRRHKLILLGKPGVEDKASTVTVEGKGGLEKTDPTLLAIMAALLNNTGGKK